jgi:hypothetical protein
VEGEAVNGEEVLLTEVCKAGRDIIGGRRFGGGPRGRDDSAEREGELVMEGRLFCSRFDCDLSSGDPKVKVPAVPKLSRLSLEEEVERDQRFTPSISSTLGRRTSAEVTGRASLKSNPLYSGVERLGWAGARLLDFVGEKDAARWRVITELLEEED